MRHTTQSPPSPISVKLHRREQGSPLKYVTIIPLSVEGIAFGKRNGLTVHTLFNMSEVPCPLVAEPNPAVTATCGKPRAGMEVRLVDNIDCEVAQGEIGELIIAPTRLGP
jgi:carnitine-CoA ligase